MYNFIYRKYITIRFVLPVAVVVKLVVEAVVNESRCSSPNDISMLPCCRSIGTGRTNYGSVLASRQPLLEEYRYDYLPASSTTRNIHSPIGILRI